MSRTFHGFTELLRIHGSVVKSRNFPGFPDDHGIITDSRNFHGSRNYGKFRKFRNVRSIVDKTRINPCIVKINHGNVMENLRNSQGLLITYPIKIKLKLLRKYQNIFQNIPNYRKVTNKSQKHKYFVQIFRFP